MKPEVTTKPSHLEVTKQLISSVNNTRG